MILFDMLMKPADSYWKRRCHEEEIKRRAAEADVKFYKFQSEDQEQKLNVLSERDIGQYHAIEVLNRKLADMEAALKDKEKELAMTKELLAAERRASKAYQFSEKLWNGAKEART